MTRLLLDTHLVLWWLNADPRLPDEVVQRVHAPEAEVFVSQASLWEMAIKTSLGRLRVDLPEVERQVPLQGFRWLPIRNAHLLLVAELESGGEHRDPFDRLLVCQANSWWRYQTPARCKTPLVGLALGSYNPADSC
jgi:PIN domain nuclease of toxin-antitoxin system